MVYWLTNRSTTKRIMMRSNCANTKAIEATDIVPQYNDHVCEMKSIVNLEYGIVLDL